MDSRCVGSWMNESQNEGRIGVEQQTNDSLLAKRKEGRKEGGRRVKSEERRDEEGVGRK